MTTNTAVLMPDIATPPTDRMRPSLVDLGRRHGTDKVEHGYLPWFELYCGAMRDDVFDLLEIGVLEGASVRMWHDYFPHARIVGFDIKPISPMLDLPRCTFVQGSQADPAMLRRLARDYNFRMIVDDGSHRWGHQIFTFEELFPALEPSGVYVCEDLHTSFGKYVEKYSAGAPQSAAAYFLRVAEALIPGGSATLKDTDNPRLHFIAKKARSVTFVRHAAIVTT